MQSPPSRHIAPLFVTLGLLAVACSDAPVASVPELDLETSTPEAQGLDPAILAAADAHIKSDLPHLRSFLLVRNGLLVLENYYGNGSRGLHLPLHSVTKNFTSTIIGIAIDRGWVDSLDQRISDFFPEYFPDDDARKDLITVRHLLTMSSGFNTSDLEGLTSSNWMEEVIRSPLSFDPGTAFDYDGGNSHLLSGIITQVTGFKMVEGSWVG